VRRAEAADLQVPVVGPRKGILFARGAQGFEVRNLASWFHFAPMRVNGRLTRRSPLRSGDRIAIGELRLIFRDEVG
jgi:hypothetical protein